MDPDVPVAGGSLAGPAAIEPEPSAPADGHAARRDALRALAALIGEEVFY